MVYNEYNSYHMYERIFLSHKRASLTILMAGCRRASWVSVGVAIRPNENRCWSCLPSAKYTWYIHELMTESSL